jgi:hypothetical protein
VISPVLIAAFTKVAFETDPKKKAKDVVAARFLAHLKREGAGTYSKALSPTSTAAKITSRVHPAWRSGHAQEVAKALVASAPEGWEKEAKADRPIDRVGRRMVQGAKAGAGLGALGGVADLAIRGGSLAAPVGGAVSGATVGGLAGGAFQSGVEAMDAIRRRHEAKQEKRADDPNEALTTRVKGMKQPRIATPRLPGASTKGQVPVNPFSGNWVKPVKKVAGIRHVKDLADVVTGAKYRRARARVDKVYDKRKKLQAAENKIRVLGFKVSEQGNSLPEPKLPDLGDHLSQEEFWKNHKKVMKLQSEHMDKKRALWREGERLRSHADSMRKSQAGHRLFRESQAAHQDLKKAEEQTRKAMKAGLVGTAALGTLATGYGLHRYMKSRKAKQQEKTATTVGDISSFGGDVGKAMLGAGALIGGGLLAKKTLSAATRPWEKEEKGPSTRAQSAAVHAVRGTTSALHDPAARWLASRR